MTGGPVLTDPGGCAVPGAGAWLSVVVVAVFCDCAAGCAGAPTGSGSASIADLSGCLASAADVPWLGAWRGFPAVADPEGCPVDGVAARREGLRRATAPATDPRGCAVRGPDARSIVVPVVEP